LSKKEFSMLFILRNGTNTLIESIIKQVKEQVSLSMLDISLLDSKKINISELTDKILNSNKVIIW